MLAKLFLVSLAIVVVSSTTRPSALTSYNVMSDDNTSPGAVAGYPDGTLTRKFVDKINIVAVHSDDWAKYQFHTLKITFGGKSGLFQVWDYCADSDCDGCCTINRANYGFLLDIDSSAAKRVFGISDAENNLDSHCVWEDVGVFDPTQEINQYN
eukprot:TRINITY_DN2941_c0_g1_i1.p1 TRINITY_DN2941_c0_g1~~TRINITY_DN2941_c0_g1_i1.p1  ORF type:complete len:154 (-),score=37.38 TRINITY_DN2941_c0_g1_i1:116-577(-)